ncbi:MAG: DegT/DnrJ/EryC1/StrS family aminotransferase [Caldilineales bacterium]|nr:DegT/DnrJ/EryC1/StrS family aminotransferase [Caldilineales bacterium]MDW8316661.1 DegT/DnrJ/EryC1/StrS family aminotransferase [Anaerolineae bacterium]
MPDLSPIPLVDLKAQYAALKPEIDAAIARVIANASFILGPEVRAFEAAFAAYCQAEHAVGVSSGTAALELTLRALGIGPGDEVITTPFTFIATAEAISAVGATPVFADIDPATYNLDPAAVEAAVTPRTRAILPVHLYGQPADMDGLAAVARRHGLRLIEDAAQAHGAEHRGRRVGSLADAACFSFFPGKNLGCYGDGGAVVTNDAALADRVRRLRDHGRTSKYVHEEVGFGHRLDALQAAILSAKLPHLDAANAARRRLAARYSQLLADTDLALPSAPAHVTPVFHLYVVRTPRRDQVLAHLQQRGIGAGVHYPLPLHLQPAYRFLGHQPGQFPVAEAAAGQVLSLPLFPEMTEEQQDRVVSALREALH